MKSFHLQPVILGCIIYVNVSYDKYIKNSSKHIDNVNIFSRESMYAYVCMIMSFGNLSNKI